MYWSHNDSAQQLAMMREYEERRRIMVERRERLLAEQRKEFDAIDNIADPGEQMQRRRRMYACGDQFIPVHSLPTWTAQKTAISASNQLTSVSSGSVTIGKVAQPKDEVPTDRMSRFMHPSMRDAVNVTEDELLPRYTPNDRINDKVVVFRGDITKIEADAIVNAANTSLMGGGGIDGAIHSAAGPLLDDECQSIGGCPTGSTCVTRGYCLPARSVLHTVGPMGSGDAELQSCYESILQLTVEHGFRSVVFCCVSTGIYGFPLVRATHIAMNTVRKWLETGKNADLVDRVVFCTFRPVEQEVYELLGGAYFPVDGAANTEEEHRE